MTICADDGNENIELYYFGNLIDVKGEKSKYISDTDDKPMLIVGGYKGEDFVIHDNSKHGYDNMFCDIYSLEQTNVVATSQVLGVGVDGLQHKFKTIVVLDPVNPSDGDYDDYRQLLWRVTGSRQQHDVRVIEFYF